MDLEVDLTEAALEAALPGRAFRTYPAVLSTEADAQAWARQGASDGAVVVAGYQASPRGRAGFEWTIRPTIDLGFTAIYRPNWSHDREGWIYSVATAALSDVIGPDASIRWPDEIWEGGHLRAAVGAHVELGPERVDWLTLNVTIRDADQPRSKLLATSLSAIEQRLASLPDAVLTDHIQRCSTIGTKVSARLIPMGPGGVEITGTARGTLMDGALLIETDEGRRIAVRPQNLGLLEEPPEGTDQIEAASEP